MNKYILSPSLGTADINIFEENKTVYWEYEYIQCVSMLIHISRVLYLFYILSKSEGTICRLVLQ